LIHRTNLSDSKRTISFLSEATSSIDSDESFLKRKKLSEAYLEKYRNFSNNIQPEDVQYMET
jgi:hypothetical protein